MKNEVALLKGMLAQEKVGAKVKAERVVTRKIENVGRDIVKERKEKMRGNGEDKVKRIGRKNRLEVTGKKRQEERGQDEVEESSGGQTP